MVLITEDVRITGIEVGGHRVLVYPNWVGPEFFQTMGIPLLRGDNSGDRRNVSPFPV